MTGVAQQARRGAGGGPDETGPTRVLVVEDHRSIAQALVVVLRAEGMEADLATGPRFDDVVEQATAMEPHVVLLDLDLGPVAGLAMPLIEPLCSAARAVVMLSGVRDRRMLAECVERGAVGVVDKAEPMDVVIDAVRTTAEQGRLMSDGERFEWLADLRVARADETARLEPFRQLTPREQDVLVRLGEGRSAAEIADLQYVSIFTVRGHIRSVLTKLGVGSQLAAVALAREAGWLP